MKNAITRRKAVTKLAQVTSGVTLNEVVRVDLSEKGVSGEAHEGSEA